MSGSKRSLPSWMGSSKDGEDDSSKKKKHAGTSEKAQKRPDSSKDGEDDSSKKKHAGTSQKAQKGPDFSKLLDGVVLVLSGFVNPERSTLRSQALDMGAEYRADWTSDCTLLVCAFVNTPKFRQVQADNGTIVSKDWIFESHKERKLVDIEPFLMHAGKPWRKTKEPVETDQDEKETHKVHQKQVQRSRVKPSTSDATEAGNLESANRHFSPSKIKQWALDDLAQTVSWLDSQEEKPEPSELKTIASEGVITCLQDAIESLEQGNDIKGVAEQWSFVPHVVNELLKLDVGGKGAALPKEQLCQLADKCKKIYQAEFARVDIDDKNRDEHQNDSHVTEHRRKTKSGDEHYDSDETIEMTEEEIDFACRQLPGLCG